MGHEVRRYTQEIHGDNFVKLAKQFATKFQYEVKLASEKGPQYCKNCGSLLED